MTAGEKTAVRSGAGRWPCIEPGLNADWAVLGACWARADGTGDCSGIHLHATGKKKLTAIGRKLFGSPASKSDYLLRLLYSPVRVSISMRSPWATNKGTLTLKPVAIFAGFRTLPEVSPLTAGSV